MVTETCPGCEAAPLEHFFSLESTPVYCNVLWPTRDAAVAAQRGRIELGFCDGCGLIYNRAFDPRLLAYTPEYENSLHFSARFQEYAAGLAERLIAQCKLVDKDVIEIGCGKGEFLAELCRDGRNRGLGFDATYAGEITSESVRIVRDHYGAAYADEPADLICCRHVLEHIDRPYPFLDSIRRAADSSPSPWLYLEVPDGLWTLRDLGIWDIIYEHCSYFTRPSLLALIERAGLVAKDCHTSFGGQFLCVDAVVGQGSGAVLASELDTLRGHVDRFAAHYADKVGAWTARVADLLGAGSRLAVWGAGSKGVTFLNAIPGGAEIDFVIDLNPRKHGRFVPGTGQCVDAPDALVAAPPDVVLVMNPLYADEIQASLAARGLAARVEVV